MQAVLHTGDPYSPAAIEPELLRQVQESNVNATLILTVGYDVAVMGAPQGSTPRQVAQHGIILDLLQRYDGWKLHCRQCL